MTVTAYTIAFLMGITGSLHCAGMCGPIVWIMPFQGLAGVRRWIGICLYHVGRISVYAFLGLLLHSFKTLFHPQWQQYISIILGSFLLLAGLMTFLPLRALKMKLPWTGLVTEMLGGFMGRTGMFPLLAAGVLNGLLPCGLVYMALSASVAAGSAAETAALMYTFGLGTMPMLIGLTILKSKVKPNAMMSLRKFVPVALFIFGLLFIFRGMNLGIPYISPRIVQEQSGVKLNCCNKCVNHQMPN